jgi:diguanylate cyclase (GGDEF)-like protein
MTSPDASRPLAIIADDEDLGRVLLAESVAELGLHSMAFGNGVDALASALSNDVTIVLLDVDMPGLDGFEVCRRLRAEPRFANVPIVMVTGHEDSLAIGRAFEAGATDFVAKPVNWALLPRRLEYILRNAAAARALNERMVQVRTLVEAIPDTLWVVDAEGRIQWSPHAEGHVTTGDEALTLDSVDVVPPKYVPQALDAISHTARDGVQRKLEYREDRVSYEMRFTRREGGDVVVVRQDTTERTVAAERIERLAYFDVLTGLPNRQRCIDVSERMFFAASRANECVAVICLDINSLKRVNDTFGHSTGDAVLRAFATRLQRTVEKFGADAERLMIARFGGDEFIVVLRHASARSFGTQVANACSNAFSQPITQDSLEFYAAPSVGLALYPDDGPDVSTVLKNADTAMYQSRAGSTGAVASYSAAMSSRMRDWLELEGRLRRAVHNDLLNLVFQPKFRIDTRQLVGVEALLRWHDVEYGDISPVRFVEIAEDSGLILDMSSWVVRAACRQIRKWLDKGFRVPVAINCSGKELLHGDPARVVEAEAAAAGVPPSLIEIEITESLLVRDSSRVQGALQQLRKLGCRIALDDFGTGYSSLAYITRFPPDRIKIDKAFVREVDRSASDAAIANAILSLAASLNLTVTAEGVERPGQLEWLRTRGCHEAQGFLLARPLMAAEFEARYLHAQHYDDPPADLQDRA